MVLAATSRVVVIAASLMVSGVGTFPVSWQPCMTNLVSKARAINSGEKGHHIISGRTDGKCLWWWGICHSLGSVVGIWLSEAVSELVRESGWRDELALTLLTHDLWPERERTHTETDTWRQTLPLSPLGYALMWRCLGRCVGFPSLTTSTPSAAVVGGLDAGCGMRPPACPPNIDLCLLWGGLDTGRGTRPPACPPNVDLSR